MKPNVISRINMKRTDQTLDKSEIIEPTLKEVHKLYNEGKGHMAMVLNEKCKNTIKLDIPYLVIKDIVIYEYFTIRAGSKIIIKSISRESDKYNNPIFQSKPEYKFTTDTPVINRGKWSKLDKIVNNIEILKTDTNISAYLVE